MTMEDNRLGPWGVAAADQMAAAVADDNWPLVAQLAVDGWLHTCAMDRPDDSRVPFEEAVASFINMKQHNLVLLVAEAMCRLYNQGKP